jgi:dienelactone hydrolase
MRLIRLATTAALTFIGASSALAQEAPPAPKPKLKDELRMPWTRGDLTYIRRWLVMGPIAGDLQTDHLTSQGGETSVQPQDGLELKRADGSTVKWHVLTSWADAVGLEDLEGNKDGVVAYASAKVTRASAGRALLSVGSDEGIRVWLNGKLVLSRDGLRSLVPDEDQIEVDMIAGENLLLAKVPQQMGRWAFCARVLEPGTVVKRKAEIGPSIIGLAADGFTLRTDISNVRADADAVKVEVVGAGGKVLFTTTAARGATVPIEARAWPDGPYEARCTTRTFDGRLYASHLAWYKGDSLAKARDLAAAAAQADASQPEGFTLRMLAEMVEDRLGGKLGEATGNPWWKIHSPLMEYDELMLERSGQTGRIRPYGFVRLAYRDEVDGSPQFCRAYLPAGYDPTQRWPLVVQIHGYNPANPVYVRWWSADRRHADVDTEFSNRQRVIYMEPHGRGNTQYLGIGDSDVVRAIAEAKKLLGVDEDRVYLTGDSMGGWGTWNVASRHPDLFAAIAPVFGGADYHSQMSEEELGTLSPVERFFRERQSSWAMADGLLNVPILVLHGDMDQAVSVEYSRWALRLLQRWGYDVRYHEFPGRIHEALECQNNGNMSIEWFLRHRRDPNPRKVRIRSAELRHASAYWAQVDQAKSPLAFMAVDAEIVDRNVIRLDTENVLEVALSPSAALVDPSKAVRVVWNGAARVVDWQEGRLRLAAPGYAPAAVRKTRRLPGALADFTVTPFAVVVGTISKDPELAALCEQKAKAFIDGWRDWQKQEPRVFKDTEISDADMTRYSLLLVGGPEANRATKKLAARLPLQIATERVVIDGKAFLVKDAAVQMIYPNPLNAERYVWVAASTSADGMYFCESSLQPRGDWDYVIRDGRFPAHKQPASPLQTNVVSGMFDYNWRISDALAQPGDAEIRGKGRLRHRPRASLVVDPKAIESYLGRYQVERGPLLEVTKDGKRLLVKQQGQSGPMELVPETETSFCILRYDVWISFTRDASGKVTGFIGYQNGDFEGKKLD